MPDLQNRRREEEWMDASDASPVELSRSLQFIRIINRWLGYTRATIAELEQFSKGWPRDRIIQIVDVATGSADIPLAILKWADRRGFQVRVIGIERHPLTADIAKRAVAHDPRLTIIRGDALSLPLADRSVDYAITAMFLHHLDDGDVIVALSEMNRIAARGVIACDLIRNRRAYAWISLFTCFARPMVKHDARVSVAQAFSEAGFTSLLRRAGIEYAIWSRRFAHRFVVAGEK